MRWLWYRRILIVLVFLSCIGGTVLSINTFLNEKNEEVSKSGLDNTKLILGGMAVGIYMETDGVLVLDTEGLEDRDGKLCEPAKNLVKKGDYILSINQQEVSRKRDLIEEINKLKESEVHMVIRRDDKYLEITFDAIEIEKDNYKLGVWVRDSVQGLGTITYLTDDNKFGALGHGIHDSNTEDLIEIESGRVYGINIVGIQKGKRGEPGGIEGVIIYNQRNILGTIDENTDNGIYGEIEKEEKLLLDKEKVGICTKKDIEIGDAVIRCSIEGEIKEYDIRIISVDYFTRNENKGILLEVTDEELLEVTGGIVQGMSGSPIIQDGKLVGAVTHVLVNDPTRGYGIFIENMLEIAG